MNSKRGDYAKVIDEIAAAKICPFCPEHIHRIHPNSIDERQFWLVTDNAYPYKFTKHHILIVHKAHIEHVSELSSDAWGELQQIVNELTKTKNITGGSFFMRFGDTNFTGASVAHLHAQLLQSNPDDTMYDIVSGVQCRLG